MNYLSYAQNGVININNEDPKLIANEIVKLLKNKKYRELEGKKLEKVLKIFQMKKYIKDGWNYLLPRK